MGGGDGKNAEKAAGKEKTLASNHAHDPSQMRPSAQPLESSHDPELASQLDIPMSPPFRARIQTLRKDLLSLHKVLLEGEKIAYEKAHGTIQGVNHYLNLVMSDPHFDWLHRISELIVEMDEALDDPKAGSKAGSDLIESAHLLFQTAGDGEDSDFMTHYKECLKTNAAAILAHAQMRRSLLSDA